MKHLKTFENFVNEKLNTEDTLTESFTVKDLKDIHPTGGENELLISDSSKSPAISHLQNGHIQWEDRKKALVNAYPNSRGGYDYVTIIKCDEDKGIAAIKKAQQEFGGKTFSDSKQLSKDIVKFLKANV